jgi:hypothetical protein
VQIGDISCGSIVERGHTKASNISLSKMLDLNPTVKKDCDNVVIGQKMCLTTNILHGTSYVYIKSQQSDSCLTKSSDKIKSKSCSFSDKNQRFVIDLFQVKFYDPKKDNELCLSVDVTGDLSLLPCYNSPAQMYFKYATGEIRAIGADMSQCVTIPSSSRSDDRATVFPCGIPLPSNQLWTFESSV